jgi:Holliday junction resolvase RusA-like endonuclease
MTESMEINLDFLPPRELSPNGRAHWSKRYRAAQVLSDHVIVRAREARTATITPAAVVYHVRWCGRAPDEDNFIASMKPGLDALVHADVLVDDSPEHVVSIEVSYERVRRRSEAGVRITVSPA